MSNEDGASNNELLMAACRDDNLDLLDQVLSSDPTTFNVNYTDGLGNSALHYAARNASTECLEVLLYFDGINVNIANRIEGDTPLHKAAAYQDPDVALEMVQVLVNHGASLNASNKLKQKPVDKAPSDTHGEVKDFLQRAALGAQYDARDIVGDDDDDESDGVPSDDE
ncbi:ankyrin repeat-containing domain protein [Gamsiella multidivaricata]|uniref:ankyrin repeat-containing domain protein n=1 Tax=Gamsiella multidivaricata TaxID=101098 RepID=UPI002220910D|nr:ankyrin repeat-containing domain protein [Gamsiella multidivaricata]KAG0370815.1 hypothetical protein BGZ54_003811 [Gamsiella multidivaricata]KAI7825286.1 ankyrin repeat-containing domain protein [Gamsiella multidivaricata]